MIDPAKRSLAAATDRGFTLVELMVTVAVLAILLALAVPSFTGLIRSNRLTGAANELIAALQLTRSEAVRLNGGVSLCRSDDGATCASGGDWTRILIVARDGTVLRSNTVRTGLIVNSEALDTLGDKITFGADGIARNGSGTPLSMHIEVCMPVTNPSTNVRRIEMVGGSRILAKPMSDGGTCTTTD